MRRRIIAVELRRRSSSDETRDLSGRGPRCAGTVGSECWHGGRCAVVVADDEHEPGGFGVLAWWEVCRNSGF